MKGLQGLLIAIALGIVGAVCNWFYITRQAANYEKMAFVVIRPGAQINPGDRFKESHFEPVEVPVNNLGNLETIAVRWRDLNTVIGEFATRSYSGNELLLREDLKTPPQRDLSELLGEDEVLRWVPVDQRSFAPDHVNPGNFVKFVVPMMATVPANTAGNGEAQGLTESTEYGPFEILTLGNRRGRKDVLVSRGGSTGQENLIGIRVELDGPSGVEADRLFEALRLTGNRGVEVVLLSDKVKPY